MYKIFCFSILVLLTTSACARYGTQYSLGKWQPDDIENLIQQKNLLSNENHKVAMISGNFLGTPYKSSTLIGSLDTPETLVLNLEEVDCLTFLDYVEAFRLTNEPDQLPNTLRQVRYQEGDVSYQTRHHFFTDWIFANKNQIDCVTSVVGGNHVEKVQKTLNRRNDGGYFLTGIDVKERTISYIPATKVPDIISRLESGDYIGFYTETQGLDVTHVGIIIKTDDQILLRHASSKKTTKKVVDEDFLTYITKQTGIIVARPKK